MQYDDFVDDVVDASNPQETQLIFGYIGKGCDDDHIRAYSDINLSSYVEFHKDDVVADKSAPKEMSPMGGSYVWLKTESRVKYSHHERSVSDKLGILSGQVEEENMPQAMRSMSQAQTGHVEFQKLVGRSPQCCHPGPYGRGLFSPEPNMTLVTCNPFPTHCGFTCEGYPGCGSLLLCTPGFQIPQLPPFQRQQWP